MKSAQTDSPSSRSLWARWVQRRVEYNVTPMARGPGRFILEMARRKGAGDFVGYGAKCKCSTCNKRKGGIIRPTHGDVSAADS